VYSPCMACRIHPLLTANWTAANQLTCFAVCSGSTRLSPRVRAPSSWTSHVGIEPCIPHAQPSMLCLISRAALPSSALPVLIALKRSHVFWPVQWDKHIRDLHALIDAQKQPAAPALQKQVRALSPACVTEQPRRSPSFKRCALPGERHARRRPRRSRGPRDAQRRVPRQGISIVCDL
jgi:hypothetical protein